MMKGYTCVGIIYLVTFKINFCRAQYNISREEHIVDAPCNSDTECTELGFQDFKCTNNVCRCDKDSCSKSFVKTFITKIGESCTESSTQCFIENSYCTENEICQCINGSISSADRRKCLNISSIGSACEEVVQCYLSNSKCLEGKCTCRKDMHVSNGTCFKTVELGSICIFNEECSATKFGICRNHLCVCPEKYVRSTSASKCLLKAENLSSQCSEIVQCTSGLGSGAMCLDGFCKCSETHQFKPTINKCVMDVFLGEICGNHSDCHQPGLEPSRLECVLGQCKCKPLYIEGEGVCYLSNSESISSSKILSILPYILSYVFYYVII